MVHDSSTRARRSAWTLLTTGAAVLATSVLTAPPATAVDSPLPVALGTSSTYSVLAGSAVTNTLVTTLNGDLGISPGAALTGFPPGVTNGETHLGDTPAALARTEARAAFTDAKNRTFDATVLGDQAGQTFTPGVYASATTFDVSADGIVTLDGQTDPNAVFIFQIDSALGMGARSSVRLINGAKACNVFWQVGSAATVGASSDFVGTILADAAVTIGAQTTVQGRVFAGTAVTLAQNTFRTTSCAVAPPDGGVDAAGAAAGADSVDGANAAGAANGDNSTNGSNGAGTGGTDGVNGSNGAGTGGTDGVNGSSGAGAGGTDVGGASDSVTSTPRLPDTGAGGGLRPLLLAGILMVVVGGFLLVMGRRPRPAGRHRVVGG